MNRLLAVVSVVVSAATAPAQTTLFNSDGFEAPGYSLGNLVGQNGWTNTFGTPNFTVQNTVTAGGSGQAVRTQGGADEGYVWPSLNYTPVAGDVVRIQADIARSTPANTSNSFSYSIDVFDPAANRTTQFGLLNVSGVIRPFVTAPYNTATGQFDPSADVLAVPVGGAIPANTFVNFDARLDYATKQLRLFVNGSDVGVNIPFADPTASVLGDADLQVSSGAGAVDFGYFDNYVVSVVPVPEPLTCGLAAAGGLLAVRLRRRLARAG